MRDPVVSLDRFIARAGELYSLPAVAIKVIALTDSPKVDVRALKASIENDPALTTRILRVVNSSLFGLPREVCDLNQALALLGTKPLKLLVLGFSLPEAMLVGVEADVLGRYWRRALTRAVAAREISALLGQREEDEAFIAGLLQDVGMLVLVRELGEPYMRFLDRAEQERTDLAALEHAALGFTHLELSAGLLDHWRMPQPIVRAIAASFAHESAEDLAEHEQLLTHILRLAEAMTALVVDRRSEALSEMLALARDVLGLADEKAISLVAKLEDKVAQLAAVLSLSLPGGVSYCEVLAAAQRKLARVAAETVGDVVRAERARAAAQEHEANIADGGVWPEARMLGEAVEQFLQPGMPSSSTARHTTAGRASRRDPTGPRGATIALDLRLEGELTAVVNFCRASRVPLTLLVVAIDRFAEFAFSAGAAGIAQIGKSVARACRQLDHANLRCLPAGDGVWAVILADCDRNQAVKQAGAVVAAAREVGGTAAMATLPVTVSVGVVTVTHAPPSFPIAALVEKASRCLYAAQASGGNGLKSIEIY